MSFNWLITAIGLVLGKPIGHAAWYSDAATREPWRISDTVFHRWGKRGISWDICQMQLRTNPPTEFLPLKLDFASVASTSPNLIPRQKTLRSTNMTSFFPLSSLFFFGEKSFFQLLPENSSPALPANWWKKNHASAWRQFLAWRNPCCWAELAAGASKIEVGAYHGTRRSFFYRNEQI